MEETAPARVAPAANPEMEAFWRAASEGRLLVGHCKNCGAHHYYPRALCPHCFSDAVTLEPAAGTGEIYSVSVMRRGPATPYAVAYVRLDEGVSVLTNIVEADLDALRIGQRVRVVFKQSGTGQWVPMFRPAG
jgi:uncharacterized OB-fold protein